MVTATWGDGKKIVALAIAVTAQQGSDRNSNATWQHYEDI